MFAILIWALFGFLVGILSKMIHPGEEPVGCLPTIAIGVAGSFMGGMINWLLGMGSNEFRPSGFIMSILGGVICCAIWRMYSLKTSETGPKNFFTGKNIK